MKFLINENKDIHGQIYRLWVEIKKASYDLVDIKITSTYTGSSQPNLHKTLWSTSLPVESIKNFKKGLNNIK